MNDSEQPTPASRRPADTISVLTYRTGPQDANIAGHVHGGWIMKLCDDAAVIAASRHVGGRVVTAAVDGMKFRSPVHVGDLVTLRASVNAAWRTSLEVACGSSRRTCARAGSATPAPRT